MDYVRGVSGVSEITHQFFQNQAKKNSIPGLEQPPQVGKAVPTEGQSPGKAGEPTEFSTGGAMDNTARGQGKTDNLKNDSGGIKKSVGPRSVARGQ